MAAPQVFRSKVLVGSYTSGRAACGELENTVKPRALVRRDGLHAVVATMRPRQWMKNALIVAAAGAAGALGQDDVPVRVGLACVAFCLLASATYAVNDVRDAQEDRLHPNKRHRPVAAGRLSSQAALVLAALLAAAGLSLCAVVQPLLTGVGAGYVALTLSYTFVWRRVVMLDLLAIAGGFVLRAVAGGVAAPVSLSRWFMLVVSATAVLIAAGKRYAELRRTGSGGARRRVLDRYPRLLLRCILLGSAAVALLAYCMWAFKLPSVDGIPWRLLTIAPFGLCLVRYCLLVRSGAGEAPEELLFADRALASSGAAWLVLFSLGVAVS